MTKKDKTHKYIGAEKCKTCHKKDKDGKQYKIWKDGPHAKAMEALASPEALKIAKEKGIADPATAIHKLFRGRIQGQKKLCSQR